MEREEDSGCVILCDQLVPSRFPVLGWTKGPRDKAQEAENRNTRRTWEVTSPMSHSMPFSHPFPSERSTCLLDGLLWWGTHRGPRITWLSNIHPQTTSHEPSLWLQCTRDRSLTWRSEGIYWVTWFHANTRNTKANTSSHISLRAPGTWSHLLLSHLLISSLGRCPEHSAGDLLFSSFAWHFFFYFLFNISKSFFLFLTQQEKEPLSVR